MTKKPNTALLALIASCQLLAAQFFKDHSRIAVPRWEENVLLYHLFALVSTRINEKLFLSFQSKPASIQAINSTPAILTKSERHNNGRKNCRRPPLGSPDNADSVLQLAENRQSAPVPGIGQDCEGFICVSSHGQSM
jgi:hypothetical protein